jgi:hypothetical protein
MEPQIGGQVIYDLRVHDIEKLNLQAGLCQDRQNLARGAGPIPDDNHPCSVSASHQKLAIREP